MLSFIKRYIPIIIIFTATCLFFGKVLLPTRAQILSSGDIKHIHYPYREFLRNTILSGQVPFWNPYIFAGLPYLSHPYTAFAYPTTLSLILLPSNLYFSIIPALHLFIAAVSMYFLIRKFTDKYSALIGAVIFAFSGFFAARIYAGHIDYITSGALIPLIFLLAYEFIIENNKRSLLFGGIILAFQIFTGLINMVFYTFLIILIFDLFIINPKPKDWVKIFAKIFILFIIGFGLSSIYLLPSYQFISQTIRGTKLPYDLTALGSSTLQTLLLFINPNILGSDFLTNNPFHGPPPNYHEYVYFVGLTPLLIIALGMGYHLYKKRINKKIIALLVITLLALIISLGPNSPLNIHLILWKVLPIYQTTRFPVRHLVIVVFALSFLTGLFLKDLKSKSVKLILLLVIIIELFTANKKFVFLSNLPKLLPEEDTVVTNITTDKELIRILPDFTLNSPVREKISFASPLIYRYFSTSGYTPAILSSYYEFIDRSNGNVVPSLRLFNSEIVPSFPYLPAISYLNTKYIIVDNSIDLLADKKDNYQQLSQSSLYRVYQAKNYSPRFFFVSEAKEYKNKLEVSENLNRDQQDLKNKIFITAGDSKNIAYKPDCTNLFKSKIEVVKYDLNRIILKADFPCNGFLSSSESYFPGWKAIIDGKNTPILLANLSFRALNVPAGTHTITMYYQPTIFYLGGLISLIFLSALIYYTSSRTISHSGKPKAHPES